MKKVILGLAIAFGSLAYAQQSTGNSTNPSFGIKGGMNVADLSNTSSNVLIGYYGGVYMNAPLSGTFSLQPEVLYSLQGIKAKHNSDSYQHLGYINVPVMVQYNATPNFYAEFGPQAGFLVDAKSKTSVGNASVSVKNKDDFKTFDLGFGLGLGYKIADGLSINARYTAGVLDILKHNNGDAVRNDVFQVGLGYTFK